MLESAPFRIIVSILSRSWFMTVIIIFLLCILVRGVVREGKAQTEQQYDLS